jgi:hypothetical protein
MLFFVPDLQLVEFLALNYSSIINTYNMGFYRSLHNFNLEIIAIINGCIRFFRKSRNKY